MTAPTQAGAARVVVAAPTVSVELPIPPRTLGKGASYSWQTVRRDYAEYQLAGFIMLSQLLAPQGIREIVRLPWGAARMDVEWRFAGIQPDDDNVITRVACFRDAAEHVGLVANDRDVSIGAVTFTRVRRADQCCVLTFTRQEQSA